MSGTETSSEAASWERALWAAAPFDTFTADERRGLLSCALLQRYAANETIYEPGDASDTAYILVSGETRLSDPLGTSAGGESVAVSAVGTLISKSSLLDGFKHRHQFAAVRDAVVLSVTRSAFMACFAAGDTFALKLLDHVVVSGSAEVRELNHAIQSLLEST